MCSCCGINYNAKSPTMNPATLRKSYFNTSHSYMYKGNEGRISVCKYCVVEMYKHAVVDFRSKIDALYYMCAVFDWFFDESAFNKVENEEVEDIVSRYLQKANLQKGRQKPKTFRDTLLEGISQPNKADTPDGSQTKTYNSKWLGEYTAHDIEYLDNYYNALFNDYKIITENHRDYARKIAKASLYMDKCFERMMNGVEGADVQYAKAREAFDTLSKSAKFAEQTRNANDVGLGSFGKIVEKVEKGQYIPKHTPLEKDDIDKLLDYFQTIEKSL